MLFDLTFSQLMAVLAFVLAAFVVYVLTPLMGALARRMGAVSVPLDERRMHVDAMPMLGGLGMYLAVVITVVLVAPWGDTVKAVIVGGSAITAVGLIDDYVQIRPLVKFLGQLAAIGGALAFNVRMESVSLPFVGAQVALPLWVSLIVTILWMAAIINMVNFIDGLDGLAAGVCAISALTFGLIAFSLYRVDTAIVSFALAGATLAFLRFNFHPAVIFMGDAGAMFLGFVLAVISLQGVLKTSATVALIVPLLVLAVPFFDLFLIVLRRLWRRVPFYRPGQDHVHHELVLVAGFSQRKSVLLLYGWCLLLNGAAVCMSQDWYVAAAVLGGLAAVATLFLVLLLVRTRRRNRNGLSGADAVTIDGDAAATTRSATGGDAAAAETGVEPADR
ncbi:MAG: undecaprenyl/decaprenyl-phosphate alpha-N-acetylglucosaminyl 1-phosphate transferase [Actinobacteria bacterium]|nr:undecaprenyl/decaprenyl-phosphate alpha-N-acetylglucosaminyl 1-phosphate transferase [Actinomycetota bacterium]